MTIPARDRPPLILLIRHHPLQWTDITPDPPALAQTQTFQEKYTIYDLNIAKGTTDPRVEFILPKSYCKFKHKS